MISVDPGEGAQVEEGSSVTIVVSTGPEETPEPEVTVKIPDLIGWSQEEAIWALEDQGLNYTVVEGYDATLHIGDVIDMDPGVGEEVPEGTTVTLTINTEEASGRMGMPEQPGSALGSGSGRHRLCNPDSFPGGDMRIR